MLRAYRAYYYCFVLMLFHGDNFVFILPFLDIVFLVIVHVFSIAFIVFDLTLSIAILPALKFLTTFY